MAGAAFFLAASLRLSFAVSAALSDFASVLCAFFLVFLSAVAVPLVSAFGVSAAFGARQAATVTGTRCTPLLPKPVTSQGGSSGCKLPALSAARQASS